MENNNNLQNEETNVHPTTVPASQPEVMAQAPVTPAPVASPAPTPVVEVPVAPVAPEVPVAPVAPAVQPAPMAAPVSAPVAQPTAVVEAPAPTPVVEAPVETPAVQPTTVVEPPAPTPVGEAQPIPATETPVERKKKKAPIVIIIVALIIILIGVLVAVVLNGKEKNLSTNDNTTTTTTELVENDDSPSIDDTDENDDLENDDNYDSDTEEDDEDEREYPYSEKLKLSDYINVKENITAEEDLINLLEDLDSLEVLRKKMKEDQEERETEPLDLTFTNSVFTIKSFDSKEKDYVEKNVKNVYAICSGFIVDTDEIYFVLEKEDGFYIVAPSTDHYEKAIKIADKTYKKIMYQRTSTSSFILYGVNSNGEYINLLNNKKEEKIPEKDLYYYTDGITITKDRSLYINGNKTNIKVATVLYNMKNIGFAGKTYYRGIIDTNGYYYIFNYKEISSYNKDIYGDNDENIAIDIVKKGKIKEMNLCIEDENDDVISIKFTFEDNSTLEEKELLIIEKKE